LVNMESEHMVLEFDTEGGLSLECWEEHSEAEQYVLNIYLA